MSYFSAFIHLASNGLELLVLPIAMIVVFQALTNRQSSVSRLAIAAAALLAMLMIASTQFDLLAVRRMRYFLLLWIPCIPLIAFAANRLPFRNWLVVPFVVLWLGSGAHQIQTGNVFAFAAVKTSSFQFPPLQNIVYALHRQVTPQDYLIGFASNTIDLNESPNTHDRTVVEYYLGAQLGIDGYFLHASEKRYRLDRDVRAILAAHPRILLAHDPGDEPLNYARTLDIISEDYVHCAVLVDNPDLYVRRYVHPVLGCERRESTIEFENAIQVLDYAAHYDAESRSVSTLVWWQLPSNAMLNEYNISLQILTPEWRNVRQLDRHLNNRIVPWRVFDLSTEDLPAGEYRLTLILYNRVTLEKVQGIGQGSDDASGFHTLLTFSVGDA